MFFFLLFLNIKKKEGNGLFMNKIFLIGRLTKEPFLKYTGEGKSVIRINIAVQRPYKTKDGKQEADFIPCVFWNRVAETVSNYCQKGSLIGISGRLCIRNYMNEQEEKIYITEVIAESISLLEKRRSDSDVQIDEVFTG